MEINILPSPLEPLRDLRTQFLHELNQQFICDKCHRYGWADTYLFMVDGVAAGYGSIWGTNRRQDRDAVFEFYLLPPYRRFAHEVFTAFRALSGALYIEVQTNDALLLLLLYSHARNIQAEAILFEDAGATALSIPGAVMKPANEGEEGASDCQYQLWHNGREVASGGLMLNYNLPYADIYMEVNERFRGNGYGSYIVQELKNEAYRRGRVPAARCNVHNRVSQNTLQRAGLKICGYRIKGEIA